MLATSLLLLAACASGVTPVADPQLAKPVLVETDQKAGHITIALTPEAKKLAADNLKFNPETLLATVRRALEANDLLTAEPQPDAPTLEILVNSFRTRSNFSAIMFGFMAGNDHIKGDVILRTSEGDELQKFAVSASYALGGLAGGQDSARMDWLYESFAKRTVEALTGKES